MPAWANNIFLQPVAVLNTSEPSASTEAPASLASYSRSESGMPSLTSLPAAPTQILRTTFSSIPLVWKSELSHDYRELGEALGQMTELGEHDDWAIDSVVYDAACFVAAGLMINAYPAPRIFNHGQKSVVFNWQKDTTNLYLTISADRMSALISTPERIQRRIDFTESDLVNPALLFSAVQSARSEPTTPLRLTGTMPDLPEVELWYGAVGIRISNNQNLFRLCTYPIVFKRDKFVPEKAIKLHDQPDGSFAASVAWQRFAPNSELVHAYGCRLSAGINRKAKALEKYQQKTKNVYCGAYQLSAKAVRSLALQVDDVEFADVFHQIEEGEIAHAHVKIILKHELDTEGTKTAILDRLWNAFYGPITHVCECDMEIDPHPSQGLTDGPKGLYVDSRGWFIRAFSMIRFRVCNWLWEKLCK